MRDDVLVFVEPRHMAVLDCLVQRPGVTISRQELLDAGWRDREVGDESLTEAISRLRRALGDSAKSQSYIQTVPKRGYRLVAAVRAPAAAPPRLAREAMQRAAFRALGKMWAGRAPAPRPQRFVAALLIAAAALAGLGELHREPSNARFNVAAVADPNPAWLDIDPDFF